MVNILINGTRLVVLILVVFQLINREITIMTNLLYIFMGLFCLIMSYENHKNKISFILLIISSIVLFLIGFNIL